MKKYDPIFKGLKLEEEERQQLTKVLFMLISSRGDLPGSLFLERYYRGQLRRYYFNFQCCKASFNSPDLVVRPIYRYDGKGHRKVQVDSPRLREYKRNKRNFSVQLS